jgi:hypothetical protein
VFYQHSIFVNLIPLASKPNPEPAILAVGADGLDRVERPIPKAQPNQAYR